MSARWLPERVLVYRHPVDMRNYALSMVMCCSVGNQH